MKAARLDLARHPSPFNAHAVNHTKPRRGPPAPAVAQQPEHRFAAPFRPHSGSVPGTSSRHDPASVPRAVAPAEEASQDELVGEYCMPAYVTVDNAANANFTVLEVEVQDYPGLMRVLAWVLNGLDVVAQNAILRTGPDGVAHNTFWLSSRSGKKLKAGAAEMVMERVRDFVSYCSPKPGGENRTEFGAGPIAISNSEHPEYTVVTVREMTRTPGYLLEIASVLSGLNIEVLQGVIQGCTDCGEDVPKMTNDLKGGRLFKFWVRDRKQTKLEYGMISALIYTLSIGLGFNSYPLTPVDQEMNVGGM